MRYSNNWRVLSGKDTTTSKFLGVHNVMLVEKSSVSSRLDIICCNIMSIVALKSIAPGVRPFFLLLTISGCGVVIVKVLREGYSRRIM